MSDASWSEDEREKTLLEKIEDAELLLQSLKEKVVSDDGSDVAVVNAIYNEGSLLSKNIEDLLQVTAPEMAHGIFYELASFLGNSYDEIPLDLLWDTFRDKLKLFEGTCLKFREECFHGQTLSFRGNDKWNIFHFVCSLDPPADIIKTLIDITPPEKYGRDLRSFDHLACAPSLDRSTWEYPLHVVAKFGGSLDVVKLLVDIDKEKNALQSEKRTSAIDVLIKHRKNHQPQVFSEILRYLVLSIDNFGGSVLKRSDHRIEPVSLLWYDMLMNEKKSRHEILNDDFIFLLKATCYHHLCTGSAIQGDDVTEEILSERAKRIEEISLSKAFTICLPCFGLSDNYEEDMLKELLSWNSAFLEERDEMGAYPIHNMIMDPSSYFLSTSRPNKHTLAQKFIGLIVGAVPKCARQLDNEGRLPLHIVSDPETQQYPRNTGLDIVRDIWKAYPEALYIPDRKTGLPPFALAARGPDDTLEFCALTRRMDKDDGLTSSFFLLRQYPEILSEYGMGGSEDKVPKLPAKRKREEHCNLE